MKVYLKIDNSQYICEFCHNWQFDRHPYLSHWIRCWECKTDRELKVTNCQTEIIFERTLEDGERDVLKLQNKTRKKSKK